MKECKAVFDNYSKTYNEGHKDAVKLSGFTPDYFHEYKAIELYDYLKSLNLQDTELKILNFGCGVGGSDPYLSAYFPNSKIFGCDISTKSIGEAKKNNQDLKNVNYAEFDGYVLPFSEKFDVIFVANVFHHIPRNIQEKTFKLLKESLNENGFLITFEHNPYNPMTVLLSLYTDFRYDPNTNLLTQSYMKKIQKKAGFNTFKLRYKIFFLGCLKKFIPLEKYLYNLPLGAHYYLISK